MLGNNERECGGVLARANHRRLRVEERLHEQRMHERHRPGAAILEHTGAHERHESAIGGAQRHPGQRRRLRMVEVDAEDRPGLDVIELLAADVGEAPQQQRRVADRTALQLMQWCAFGKRAAGGLEQQRRTGAGPPELDGLFTIGRAVERAREQIDGALAAERIQGAQRRRSGRDELLRQVEGLRRLRPQRPDDAYPQARQPAAQEPQQRKRVGVRPMQVVERDHHRTRLG